MMPGRRDPVASAICPTMIGPQMMPTPEIICISAAPTAMSDGRTPGSSNEIELIAGNGCHAKNPTRLTTSKSAQTGMGETARK